MFTFPAMTALLEPLTLGTQFRWRHLTLAVMVLLGLLLLNPGLGERPGAFYGMLFGLGSALCFTVRNLLLKGQVQAYAGSTLMFYQLLATVIVFAPVLLVFDSSGIRTEWPWLLLLACVTTGAGHTLYLLGLKHFSVSTASIMAGSQPVFGILLGALFLSEIPSARTLAGGALILGTVLVEAVLSGRDEAAG
jgi:drug/metabolite transporter (DMT)-like permease